MTIALQALAGVLCAAAGMLALPTKAADCGGDDLAVQALQRVNVLRSQAQVCGRGQRLAAAPPLEWHAQLRQAAQVHAQDIARRGQLSHTGSDGRPAQARLADAGYAAGVWGENLARGALDLDGAIAQWRASPAHCRNIMLAEAREMGLACQQPVANGPRYWVLLVAAPP